MNLQTPRSTRSDPLVPYTTLFRSVQTPEGVAHHHGIGAYVAEPRIAHSICGAHRPAEVGSILAPLVVQGVAGGRDSEASALRSEEHTSELQSLMRISYAVFCLTKKNTKTKKNTLDKIVIYNK